MTRINKEIFGQGKSIVLIHGWAMHTGIWRKFAQQLAKRYKVICVDLPGHGLSETIEPYTLDKTSEVLLQALSEETSFSILGWSMGASVALTMTRHSPEKINSLILLAANPRFVKETAWAGVRLQLLEQFANDLSENCNLTLLRFLTLQVNQLPNSKEMLKKLKKAIHECEPATEKVLQCGLEILKQTDLRNYLSTLYCPLDIIQGDKDPLIPVNVGYNIQKIQPACTVHIIPGAGHIPFISHQQQVIEIISRNL